MNIAISGFSDTPEVKKLIEKNFNISETVDNVKFLLIKNDIDFVSYKSSKIKQALTKNLPIIYFEKIKDMDFIKHLKNLNLK